MDYPFPNENSKGLSTGICPCCGYCDKCGRRNQDFQPYTPYPYQPYITWGYTTEIIPISNNGGTSS